MDQNTGRFYDGMAKERGHDVSQTLEKAYRFAEEILESQRIDMESFKSPQGNYDPQMVDRDLRIVADLEHKFNDKMTEESGLLAAKHTATVFEALLAKQIQENRWFGGNTELISTSKYDDYVNGVDGVLRIKESGRNDFLALGVDVTYSANHIDEKIRRIKNEIKEGKMAHLKYFKLPDGSFKGELSNIPRIILGAESHSVIQMAEQWMNGDTKTFSKHWMQSQLLELSIAQCKSFSFFAASNDKPEIQVAYFEMGKKLELIYKLRQKLVIIPEDRDRMYKKIIDLLPTF